jgi:hypothetical protein
MDKVRKPNISENVTPSSESYSNYLYCHLSPLIARGFGLVTGFINKTEVVTTMSYYTFADLYNV